MKVLDRLREHAKTRPEHPALVVDRGDEPPETVSYARLVADFEALGAELREKGVAPGDRCGLRARQGRPFVEAALGILAADACMVPIPDDTAGDALATAVKESSLHHLLEALPERRFESFADVPAVDGRGDALFRSLAPAYMRFTSGTTHLRKGVIVGAEAVAARLENGNRSLGIGPEDRILWLLPMAHHFLVSILLYLRFGATILLPKSSFAAPVLDLAAREHPTVLYASPYHYGMLAKDASERGLAGVRLAVSTADGLRAETADLFRQRFGFPLVQALGIIEVGLPVMNRASAETKPTALGRPTPGYEIWLRGDDGAPLAESGPERTGEICIRGTGLFDAYLSPFTLATDALDDGSFRTGDQGWFDADGDLHLEGRRSNRINMAGMKFFCEEVEAAIDAHPAVTASRVYPKLHPALGEIPAAQIVVAAGHEAPDRRTLAAFLRERLAGYKIPREFEVVESLPMTATGKVKRWDA
ncbi:MAG: class I adenylate-forming enzyme family protein [Myxococcota bacterium]